MAKLKNIKIKHLLLIKEIGYRKGEATCYGSLGSLFSCLGEYRKAEEYQEQSLVITKEVGDRQGEAACYVNLGSVLKFLAKYEQG